MDVEHDSTRHHGSLRAEGIVKRYGGSPALDGVDLVVEPGRIVGLVGHNGAGKSTLLKTLSGAVRPDEGSVWIGQDVLRGLGPSEALAGGISTVYQELSLLENLSVTENVFLGREQRSGLRLAKEEMRHSARELVERFELDVDVDRPLADYPVATRQLLEIAVATERGGRFLLLDEPTTSLEADQIDRLLDVVESLARQDDVGVLFINHKLDELYRVVDDIVVLVDGEVRVAGPVDRVDRPTVLQAIAGEEAAGKILAGGGGEIMSSRPDDEGASATSSDRDDDAGRGTPATLEVDDLRTPVVPGVTLRARRGRVLGIYGLIGSGRTEFLRALAGLDRVVGGEVRVDGGHVEPRSPHASQRAGIVYLTEERKHDGIIPQLGSVVNVMLPVMRRHRRLGRLHWQEIDDLANEYMDRLQVRGDRTMPVDSLSGGNQQKVLLARTLAQGPKVLLLDEPTKGVDIGVKVEIHRLLRDLAHDQGLAVVVVSSEEEEILDVADEVVVFVEGRPVGPPRPASELSQATLRQAAWSQAA